MSISKKLNQLIEVKTDFNCTVTGLTLDSRKVQPGELFFALSGTQTHGSRYIDMALQQGAIAVLKEADTSHCEWLQNQIPCISIPNLSQKVGTIAAQFYDNPTHKMQVVGITGTNGKTTVSHIIAQLLQHHAINCGLIGTLGYGLHGKLQAALNTTPDAVYLQKQFAQWSSQNIHHIAMEVSSHALEQGRVNGISFKTAVLTNLSQDHLDYHQTMQAYAAAKQKLFSMSGIKVVVLNRDDAFGQQIRRQLDNHIVTCLTYGLTDQSDVYAKIIEYNEQGMLLNIHTPWGNERCHAPLFGQFNISNVLAAITVLLQMGFDLSSLLSKLKNIKSVDGRMECFSHSEQPTVIVDYAHTPDALKNALLALKSHCQGELWCVFGCGGTRDQTKRPIMGKIATEHADKIILTNDNPRYEDAQQIIKDIQQGCPNPTAIIADRAQAIHYAIQTATKEDVILIAGKGHEDYQQIGSERFPFSDRALVQSLLNAHSN